MFIVLFISLMTSTGYAQVAGSMIAGQTISGDSLHAVIYRNLLDTLIKVRWMGGSNIEEHFYELDADQDGSIDFTFYLRDIASVGSGSAEISIIPSTGSGRRVTAGDSISTCTGIYADKLKVDDTIASKNPWSSSKAMFHYRSWGPWSGYSCGKWNNEIEQFAGISMIHGPDTSYGWIKLSVYPFDVYLALVLHDCALMKKNPLGVDHHEWTGLRLFPNPASEYFYMQTDTPGGIACLYNAMGRIIFSRRIQYSVDKIAIGHLTPGFYLFHYLTNKGNTIGKLVIQ